MIEKRVQDGGRHSIIMLECPACGADLRGERSSHHIRRHDPEDFGLSPLGGVQGAD